MKAPVGSLIDLAMKCFLQNNLNGIFVFIINYVLIQLPH